jgi:hypothetical protein
MWVNYDKLQDTDVMEWIDEGGEYMANEWKNLKSQGMVKYANSGKIEILGFRDASGRPLDVTGRKGKGKGDNFLKPGLHVGNEGKKNVPLTLNPDCSPKRPCVFQEALNPVAPAPKKKIGQDVVTIPPTFKSEAKPPNKQKNRRQRARENREKLESETLESMKDNVILDQTAIFRHLRRVLTGTVDKPGKFLDNCFFNGATLYANKHTVSEVGGCIIERIPEDEGYDKCKYVDMKSIRWSNPHDNDLVTAERPSGFRTGKALKVVHPAVHMYVTLYSFDEANHMRTSSGLVVDTRVKDHTFGFNKSTQDGMCGGIYVHQHTGSVVGLHFLGVDGKEPNRGLSIHLN